jgi:uncharacterized protein (DUF2164 family)
MTGSGHLKAAAELRDGRARLDPASHIRLFAEASLGIAQHLVAVGSERRYGLHRHEHQGLSQWLRLRGEEPIAEAVVELESIRIGRWYGKQGNGDAAERIEELLAAIEAWALA